ncbi:MAG: UDP-N-acetylglucosamine--N-acetylmuramyl-(pentapeptide) pyrophosphoryl-undecaprenol N-acetylglucosamine transferase [Opitutales bacterium]
MSNFVISCGGTGGHLVPGIAIGEALIAKGHNVIFVISKKDIDSKIAEKYPRLEFVKVNSSPFSLNPIKALKFLYNLYLGFLDAKTLIKFRDCKVAIAFGGFNSLPISLASKFLKRHLVLHESNMKVGKSIRVLGHIADKIYIPHGANINRKKNSIVKHAGYPIRKEIKRLDKTTSKEKFGFASYEKVLLVVGGSQGAVALNKFVDSNIEKFKTDDISVLCVCGANYSNTDSIEYLGSDGKTRHIKKMVFCSDMASALSCCEVVIARSGAGSIAEFAKCKVPSILVPLPTSADDHQKANALKVERLGACIMLEQKNISKLYDETFNLFFNKNLKHIMKDNLTRIDEMNNINDMLKEIEAIAQGK